MNTLKGLLSFIALVLLEVLGIMGLLSQLGSVFPTLASGIIIFASSFKPISMIAVSITFILIPITYFLLLIKVSIHKREVVLKTEAGNIIISESAISKYLKNVLSNLPCVNSVRSKIFDTSRGIHVKVDVEIKLSDTLINIEKEIREEIKRSLIEKIGFVKIAQIDVRIEEFKMDKNEKKEISNRTNPNDIVPS